MDKYTYIRITDTETTDPSMSNNGGNYSYGRELCVDNYTGAVIAGYHWCSADFAYCPACGSFSCRDCENVFPPIDTIITGNEAHIEREVSDVWRTNYLPVSTVERR